MRIFGKRAADVACIIGITIGILIFAYFGSIIPRTSTTMFASPDETATAVFSDVFEKTGSFRIPVTTSSSVRDLLSLHPRSMVRQGEWLVPVGFLGMPFLAWLSNAVIPYSAPFLTLLLVLSSLVPLYMLTRPLGKWTAWSTVCIFATFPTVLLYENRGLFPNLPLVALTLWSVFLFSRAVIQHPLWKRVLYSLLASVSFAFAIVIRPIELVWMLPWVVWGLLCGSMKPKVHTSDHDSATGKRTYGPTDLWTFFFVSIPVMLLVFVGFLLLSMRTYPFHSTIQSQPAIGYFMMDRGNDAIARQNASEPTTRASRSFASLQLGFHPRTMLGNITTFGCGLLGLWIAASFMGTAGYFFSRHFSYRSKQIREKSIWTKRELSFLILIAWTAGSLLLLYGQTSYADNIQMHATIGNSFLRYLLPIVPFIAIGCGLLIQTIYRLLPRTGAWIATISIVSFIVIGIAYACSMDAESILPTRNEIARYQSIRSLADGMVPQGSIILSERNDKIFESGPYTAVSPLPDVDTLKRLSASGLPVFFYHRAIVSAENVPLPMLQAFSNHPWVTVFRVGNEGLYRIDGVLPPL